MKRTLFVSLMLVLLSSTGWAEFSWPDQQCIVRINGEQVVTSWRDGKPYVLRQQTLHLLHVRSGPDELDLAQVLEEQGFQMQRNEDGSIDCLKPQALAVQKLPPGHDNQAPRGMESAARAYRSSSARPSSRRRVHSAMLPAPAQRAAASSRRSHSVNLEASRALVQSIGQELAVQCRRPISWVFEVVDSPEPNAWTPGEGRVFITAGLLELQLTRDEIAGVLGHEIAHGARQHLAQGQLQEGREKKAARDAAEAQARYAKAQAEYQRAMSREDNPNGIGAAMARDRLDWETRRAQGQMRQAQRQDDFNRSYREHETVFSHVHEREADWVGMEYCIGAGYRPDGLLTALQKLQAASFANYGTQALAGSRSHPPIGQRIARLQELLRQKGY